MRDEEENNATGGIRKRFIHNTIAEPSPEKDLPSKLKVKVPPSRSFSWRLAFQ